MTFLLHIDFHWKKLSFRETFLLFPSEIQRKKPDRKSSLFRERFIMRQEPRMTKQYALRSVKPPALALENLDLPNVAVVTAAVYLQCAIMEFIISTTLCL